MTTFEDAMEAFNRADLGFFEDDKELERFIWEVLDGGDLSEEEIFEAIQEFNTMLATYVMLSMWKQKILQVTGWDGEEVIFGLDDDYRKQLEVDDEPHF